ncbi:site-specific integrase (plasmid) [Azospirillum argentinense]|uniref:Site-specific integrase n=2 Tax=Azospirillum TaxID=191 RepID=A0A4D8QGC4_AZOBR|nr:site-specific integrase [Azospirillum argentinense]
MLLDLALEDLRMHQAPLDPATLTSILTKVRDDALAADQAERAEQPPDLGFVPRPTASRRIVVPEDLAQSLLRWLAQQGPMTGIDGADLKDPDKGRADGIAAGPSTATPAQGGEDQTTTMVDEPADGGPVHRGPWLPPDLDRAIRDIVAANPAPPAQLTTARAASTIHATIAQGMRGAYLDAARRNDRLLAQAHVQRAIDGLEAQGITVQPGSRGILECQALSVLGAVHGKAASGERAPSEIMLAPPGALLAPRQIPLEATAVSTPTTVPAAPTVGSSAPTITEMLQKCIKLKQNKGWNDKSVADATTSIRMFTEFRGDVPIDKVTSADVRDYKALLVDMPKLAGKGRFAKLMIKDSVMEADALEQALNDGQVDPATIHGIYRDEDDDSWHVTRYSLATVNKHINFLNVVFTDGMKYLGYKEDASVFASEYYDKALVREHRRKRPAYEVSELESLFRSPAWVGCADDRLRATASASPPPRDARFWAPLIAAHQGMRLEEILQLQPADVGEEDGIAVFRIRKGAGRTLKTASSVRTIPVHSSLIRIGLLKHAEDRRAEGARLLFPELKRGGGFNTYGHAYSLWWTEYRRRLGIYRPGQDFHSFRTTVNTHLLRRRCNETMIKALLGHSIAGDITSDDYNAGLSLADLQQALELWQFDLSHLES